MENRNRLQDPLKGYLKQLRELLKSAETLRPIQGAILHMESGTLITDCKEIRENEARFVATILENRNFSPESSSIYTRFRENYVEYVSFDRHYEFGDIAVYVRMKTEKADLAFLQRRVDVWEDVRDEDVFPDKNLITLANAIVQEFLIRYYLPDVPGPWLKPHEKNQLLMAAGRKFTARVLSAHISEDWKDLLVNINISSSFTYESQTNNGNIALMKKEFWETARRSSYSDKVFPKQPEQGRKAKLDVCFQDPVPLTEYKRIRKLHEIATGDTVLASDGAVVFGITRKYHLAKFDYAMVCINGPLKWELYESKSGETQKTEKSSPRIVHNHTVFKLKKKTTYQKQIETCLKSMCGNNPKDSESKPCKRCDYAEKCTASWEESEQKKIAKRMAGIVGAAAGQSHGTTIVFSLHAEEEATRLGKTCFQIGKETIENDAGLILQITAIDGAVLCDFNGFCYAIGVILDGKTIPGASDETIDRGARFNSAIRYKNAFPCSIICIISEDGDVNIV